MITIHSNNLIGIWVTVISKILSLFNTFFSKAKKEANILFITAATSYVVQMMIIPKVVTIPIVLLLAGYIFAYVIYGHINGDKIKLPLFIKVYLPFVVWVLFSICWTINPNFSFILIRIILGFEFATIVGLFVRNNNDFFSVLKGFVFGGLISAAIVLALQYQYIGIIRLGNFIYGSSMEFSGGLTISCYCSLCLWGEKREKKYLLALFLFYILCALSGSRSALLYPVLFYCMMQFFYRQNLGGAFKILLFSGIIGGATFFLCMNVPAFYDVIGKRIETMLEDRSEDGSYTERMEMKRYAIEFWKEKPFIGWGCHGFATKYETINKSAYSHCDYTEILSCYGVVGAILWYGPYLYIFNRKRPLKRVKNNHQQSFLLATLLIIFVYINSSIIFVNIKMVMLLALVFEHFNRSRYNV